MAEAQMEKTLPATQKSAASEQPVPMDRISALLAIANNALNSGDLTALNAALLDLGGVAATSSEAAVLQGFVQGAILEGQARQLLQAAQTQPDVQQLIKNAVEDKIIAPKHGEMLLENVVSVQAESEHKSDTPKLDAVAAANKGAEAAGSAPSQPVAAAKADENLIADLLAQAQAGDQSAKVQSSDAKPAREQPVNRIKEIIENAGNKAEKAPAVAAR